MDIVSLIIQIVAGIVGGNAAGRSLRTFDLGPIGDSVAGGVGGVLGGQTLAALLGLGGAAGGLDIGAVVGQLVGGGVSGALVTIVVGLVRNMLGVGRRA